MTSRGKLYAPAALNRQHPLAKGLVAFYLALPHQAEGSTWYDLCGVNHLSLASLSAGYGFQPAFRPGGFGAAVKLDGTATCKRTASVPIAGLPCTLACWYATPNVASNYGLMSIDDGTASNQIGMEQFTSKIGAFLDFGAGEVYDSTTMAGSNTWYFATSTFVSGTQYAYLNGANKSTAGTSAFTPTGLNTIRVGSNTFATKLVGSNRLRPDLQSRAIGRGDNRPLLGNQARLPATLALAGPFAFGLSRGRQVETGAIGLFTNDGDVLT